MLVLECPNTYRNAVSNAFACSCHQRLRFFRSCLVLRLFAKESTEYDLLADVQKAFEPYCDLWKRVDDWMSWHKGWMNDSFLSLDAEEVCIFLYARGKDYWKTFLFCGMSDRSFEEDERPLPLSRRGKVNARKKLCVFFFSKTCFGGLRDKKFDIYRGWTMFAHLPQLLRLWRRKTNKHVFFGRVSGRERQRLRPVSAFLGC